jgi:hypothetical protein
MLRTALHSLTLALVALMPGLASGQDVARGRPLATA